ncbi:hypothetical protein PanWU01x14_124310 [Parasponia andersonii]|uniref:Uncharacterized protein n=1 Tax=Parasponia andersonii TaxID=3476 RepID=A0A2P5CTI4_PARAD|nr:hypothetical protein PanWU01x14_124310 [Parasponia andersonii]
MELSGRNKEHITILSFELLALSSLEVVWIPRDSDKSAHALASWAFRLKLSGRFSFQEVAPDVVTTLLSV